MSTNTDKSPCQHKPLEDVYVNWFAPESSPNKSEAFDETCTGQGDGPDIFARYGDRIDKNCKLREELSKVGADCKQ